MVRPISKIYILPTPTPGNIFLTAKITEKHDQSVVYYHPHQQQEPILSYFPEAAPCSLDHNCSDPQQCCQKIKDLGNNQTVILIGCPQSKVIAPSIVNHFCPDARIQQQMELGQKLLVINPESETFDTETPAIHLRSS
ncbi:MAG: hypothetical protein COS76_01835 [Candidatus Portnoybacteria bacterium CG06_land_8_20_14_3_00_39_12]|uniref:Uncharacterized protein n=2 Tax=Candidatus Portnoyibacteriota TaxID=1817913 RepID=A0A2M7UH01_9BACT|nr:MAG: hypothetical protein AUJ33_03010 [Parcubacteria group bacterium CG1_02_40_25]PIU75246.1 MAG: hypothetical protein COS76_01835 [Candidatus Portnoybacteria bacterium CG06_land_8_20_14_3_00_39_12]PIZ70518.1 MAG: hypothetical protein COY09_02835 [Candidatus Portnoybacteria bacterium CG_4_10_14_0_2_um_filter_39_11]